MQNEKGRKPLRPTVTHEAVTQAVAITSPQSALGAEAERDSQPCIDTSWQTTKRSERFKFQISQIFFNVATLNNRLKTTVHTVQCA